MDTQTHRHTDTKTHRHTDTKTHRHTDTRTQRHTDTQTHGLRHNFNACTRKTYIGASGSTSSWASGKDGEQEADGKTGIFKWIYKWISKWIFKCISKQEDGKTVTPCCILSDISSKPFLILDCGAKNLKISLPAWQPAARSCRGEEEVKKLFETQSELGKQVRR